MVYHRCALVRPSGFSRRAFVKAALAAAGLSRARPLAASPGPVPLLLEATTAAPPPRSGHLAMGASRNPAGGELTADSRSLLRNGQPWLPVMGEIHYTRLPEEEWQDALLRMKAGGIDVASTYVFWIHHEEVEGEFDWAGRRGLRRFLSLCRDASLLAVVRCGPWCHGEVRNGGLPDWILAKGFPTRSDDPGYLRYVGRLFGEIAAQLRGLLWKDGGPVVGVQCENEYAGPAEHLLTLKRMAREAGLDVPLYTRTGWPALATPMPVGELLPLFGAYAEGFWDRELVRMPEEYRKNFLFRRPRTDAAMAPDQPDPREAADGDDVGAHPYFCCEIGGGMQASYHRRIRIAPRDVEALALVKLGSGNNLQGYYMYQGGANPEGRLTTLQESQATGYGNDVPVKSYDFQAPLGELGQLRGHYHRLRRMHLFLRDYGLLLAVLPAHLPEVTPKSVRDRGALRWSARTDGCRGFVFVNNYERLRPMPAKPGVQFLLRLREGVLRMPEQPFTVPAGSCFLWPFHLDLAGARLFYATAQPVCWIEDEVTTYAIFAETAGVPAEFAFAPQDLTLESAAGPVTVSRERVRIGPVPPGNGPAFELRTAGRRLCGVLFDAGRSLQLWKGPMGGRERLFLSTAGLVFQDDSLRLRADDPADLAVSIFPAPALVHVDGSEVAGAPEGLFRRFAVAKPRPAAVKVTLESVRAAGPPRVVAKGRQGVAEAPADPDFDRAAVWRVTFKERPEEKRDLRLRIHYVGDVARVTLGGRLLADDFWNGSPFELGLRALAPEVYSGELLLKVLPLRKRAPILLPEGVTPDFAAAEAAVAVTRVEVAETSEVRMSAPSGA